MCKTARECILTWAKGFWPNFDRMPYHFDHFYKIAEREGIQVVIDSEHSLDTRIDVRPFINDNHIMINASGHFPEGDSLVCTYARLFNYYYLNKDGFQNFHFCVNPEGQEYEELCLAAGFLAVAPCRMVLEDLRNGIDPCRKYQLSPHFARRRIQMILNHLIQLKNQDNHDDLIQRVYDECIDLCEDYMARLETVAGGSVTSR